jgi:hypothetical protein
MITKPALQRIFKGILHGEDEDKHTLEIMVLNKSHEMNR